MTQASPPFSRIALSLSGGGYRAAAFHLGTLDLLHRAGLLEEVALLSTASGGTLTGARYAISLVQGESFAQFFRATLQFLCETNVVAEAFARLAQAPRDARRQSLITAAADVYASPRFCGELRFDRLSGGAGHLEEIAFNATEFQSGVAFRFQLSRNAAARFGNGNVWVRPSLARDVRLADAVAASSCFPGAFEPIGFPDDFVWREGAFPAERRRELSASFPAVLPLMDGGIYDNQGIDGLLLAERRSDGEAGLFIVSDTQQSRASLYSMRPPARARGPRLRTLYRAGQALCALLAVSAVALGADLVRLVGAGRFGVRGFFTHALPLALTAFAALALPLGWRWLHGLVARAAPSVSPDFWAGLASLRTSHALELALLRVRSVLAIMTDVFMKRVRTLGYDKLLRDATLGPRSISNLIYDLDRARAAGDPALMPTDAQLEVARRAMAVKTQLWFDRGADEALDLVACGQSTLCFNLLEFLAARPGDAETGRLLAHLRQLWSQLQADPLCLARPGER